jgi:SAM-dependent methyltransferase
LLHPDVTYIGIDTTDARENFGYELPGTVYFTGTTWPVGDETADVVLCTETLEHVPDTRQFLAELHRCLRPGGRVILTVPFSARWHYIPHDYWRFTPSALAMVLSAAGLVDVAVHARGNAGTVACAKAMALLLPLLMPQGRGQLSAFARRAAGATLSPVLLALATVGQLTLRGPGGDDCLGYTVVARKPPHPSC